MNQAGMNRVSISKKSVMSYTRYYDLVYDYLNCFTRDFPRFVRERLVRRVDERAKRKRHQPQKRDRFMLSCRL
jgi:hypothetical protein